MLSEEGGKEPWDTGHGRKEKLRGVACQLKSYVGSQESSEIQVGPQSCLHPRKEAELASSSPTSR